MFANIYFVDILVIYDVTAKTLKVKDLLQRIIFQNYTLKTSEMLYVVIRVLLHIVQSTHIRVAYANYLFITVLEHNICVIL